MFFFRFFHHSNEFPLSCGKLRTPTLHSYTMLVLASQSPRRKELLAAICIPFLIEPSQEDEVSADSCYYKHIPVVNAKLKSESVAERFPDKLVLGADTVVELGVKIIEQPTDEEDALNMLMKLSGNQHQVVTTVCLTRKSDNLSIVFSEKSQVEFNDFDEQTAREYMSKVHVLDKAGAYAVQEYGEIIIKEIHGSVTNVIGLPMEKLVEALKQIDFVN